MSEGETCPCGADTGPSNLYCDLHEREFLIHGQNGVYEY